MLEWVKSTVTDLRKHKKNRPEIAARLKERHVRSAQKKAKARQDAERARLMNLSEKELLVETLMEIRSWDERYKKLSSRLEIMERNVEEVTEGILDLEFGITSLGSDSLEQ